MLQLESLRMLRLPMARLLAMPEMDEDQRFPSQSPTKEDQEEETEEVKPSRGTYPLCRPVSCFS